MFHPDGEHLLGGGYDGIRRLRLEDGQEIGKQTGMVVHAISVSRDRKWIVCGTEEGASVWDAEMQKKVIAVEGRNTAMAVDISPDSTTFATGTNKVAVSIWHITSGERLVGPLQHDELVTGIRFSPNGARIATASMGGSIRIFDSRNGDELITIETVGTPLTWPSTPLAWSHNGQQIFTASIDHTIKLFDVSTGSQIAESQSLDGGDIDSIALAANDKFISTFAGCTISFLDTSTLSQIHPVIEGGEGIWAIAISPDSGYLAVGRRDGKITICDLSSILPDSYGPFHPRTLLTCQASLIPSPVLIHCEFLPLHRSRCHRAHPPLISTTIRLVITTSSSPVCVDTAGVIIPRIVIVCPV